MRPEDVLARMLARRDLSIEEARLRLAAAGLAAPAVDEAVRWAVSCGYLDDAKLARQQVERELRKKPPPSAGYLLLKIEARGIAAGTVAEAVRAAVDPETIQASLTAYVRGLGGRVPVRRLAGRLVRAGHAPETIEAVLESAGLNRGIEDIEDADAGEHDAGERDDGLDS